MSPIDVSDRKALAVQDTRRTAVRFAATIGRGTKFLVPPDPAHLLVQKSRAETFQQNVLQESSDTINRSCMKDHQKSHRKHQEIQPDFRASGDRLLDQDQRQLKLNVTKEFVFISC